MKKILLIAIAACGLFLSCKKSSSTTPSDNCSITAAHLQGSYKTTDAYYTSTLYTGDVYKNPLTASIVPTCKWDDVISLNAGNIYIDSTTCSGGNLTGTWGLSSDSLFTVTGSTKDTAIVSSYDCKTAIVIYNNFQGTGGQLKVTLTKQ